MARPANRLPSVSCSAKPTTTAPTAAWSATAFSSSTDADHGEENNDDEIWTIAGKRSTGRSCLHGLATSVTAALTIARTIVRRASADRSWTSPSPAARQLREARSRGSTRLRTAAGRGQNGLRQAPLLERRDVSRGDLHNHRRRVRAALRILRDRLRAPPDAVAAPASFAAAGRRQLA